MSEDKNQWFAIQVRCGREQLTATHLRVRGYEVFLPCYRELRRWSGRPKEIVRALFDGYLFCQIDGEIVGKIVTAPGVVGIVSNGRSPVPVATREVEAIQHIVQSRLSTEPWNAPHLGERVRLEAGPLRGIEGVVLVSKSRHRLVVSVSLLQRSVAVEIDSAWVRLLPPNS